MEDLGRGETFTEAMEKVGNKLDPKQVTEAVNEMFSLATEVQAGWLDPQSGQSVSHDIAAQTRRVLDSVSGLLKAEGLSLGDVLKTTIFLTDLGNFQIVNEIYGSYFDTEPPARSTVQVSALPKGAKIEIEVIAMAGNNSTTVSDTSG